MLRLDPLYVANEGVVIVAPQDAEDILDAARGQDLGAHAALIGTGGGGRSPRWVQDRA